MVLRAASVARAPSSPTSSAGGWMPRARSRSSTMASLAPRWASLTRSLTWSRSSSLRVGELLLGHAQAHGQRHQLGLGAVVEIPLDPPQGGGGGVDGLGPGLLEVAQPHGHRIGGEQRSHEQPVEVVEEPHRPGGERRRRTPR